MSVPDANALSPAPVRTSTLRLSSEFAASQISARRSYIAKVSALRACGRLKVMRPTPSRTSKRRSVDAVVVSFMGCFWVRERALGAVRATLCTQRGGVQPTRCRRLASEFSEDLVEKLARSRVPSIGEEFLGRPMLDDDAV